MHKLMRAAAAAERERERERGREVEGEEREANQTWLCDSSPQKWAFNVGHSVASCHSCKLPACCLPVASCCYCGSITKLGARLLHIHIQIYMYMYIYFMCRIQKLQRGMHQVRQKREITLVNQRVAASKIFLQ